jgi:uncharacterized protein
VTEGASAVYAGRVMHQRLRPRRHRLRYRVFSLLLDLDEIDGLAERLRLFSRNRFNLFSFYDRDYGARTTESLRNQLERYMQAAGIEADGGPIRLLTMPRVLGYGFNPLSVYFCYRQTGALAAILYEVSNTFHQRHSYMIPVPEGANADSKQPIRQVCPKQFYVSPLLDMNLTYEFRTVPPGQRVGIAIYGHDSEGAIIVASLYAERLPLNDSGLARAFVTYPLLTLKVIAGIHWEALRIWLKGVRLHHRPKPLPLAVTVGRPSESKVRSHVA